MFFEDVYDALKHAVQASGGAKRVGKALFPEKTPDAAGRYLMDCLNASRAEKLCPEQFVALLRIAREAECHQAMDYVAGSSGYAKPDPVSPEDERAALQKELNDNFVRLRQLLTKLDPKAMGSL